MPHADNCHIVDFCRYEAQLEKDWHYILEDSGSKLVIAATEAIYEKVKNYPGKVSPVQSRS